MNGQFKPRVPGERGVWEHFDLEDGLPDLKIECLFVDSQDRLWVGTRERGVACFDGERFQTFTTHNGLAGDSVRTILEDREGALWLGTMGGLSRYDGKRFETVRPRSGERCDFRASCLDQEGRLWFGLKSQPGLPPAICCWEGKELELIQLEYQAIPPSTSSAHASLNSIYEIVTSPKGDVYFGGGMLYHYDREQFHCLIKATEPRDVILSMLLRPSGELWCVLCSGALKVYADGRFTFLRSGVCGFTQDPSGAVWLTTWKDGVLRYDGTAFEVIQKTDKALGSNLCLDKQGRLWVHGHESTYGWGIFCYDTTRFEIFQKEQGLPATDVNCLAEDAEGRLWIGTSDEIGDLPLGSQAALLQFLQEKTFQRVGGKEVLHGEVRIVAATNRDLQAAMQAGRFRQDLFFRLNGFVVELPPLRQRREDIPLLVEYFAREFARHLNRPTPAVDPEVVKYLQSYDWPGNVRELEHLVQRAVLLCKEGVIRREDLAVPSPPDRREDTNGLVDGMLDVLLQKENGSPDGDLLARAEEVVLRLALTKAQGNKSKAAALLHTDRKKVERRARKYRIEE